MRLTNGLALAMMVAVAVAGRAAAEPIEIAIHLTTEHGVGEKIGTIRAEDTAYGLLLTPSLKGLAPGIHGFHVHEHATCECAEKDGKRVAGLAAGNHYDPDNTGKHLGPYNDAGHRGDLPPLYIAADGSATVPVLAPRLNVKDLKGRSLMIHAGGDNFSDEPAPLGGGGERVACGIVE
jgi:superoxide dismutase, Cu-Zn family